MKYKLTSEEEFLNRINNGEISLVDNREILFSRDYFAFAKCKNGDGYVAQITPIEKPKDIGLRRNNDLGGLLE